MKFIFRRHVVLVGAILAFVLAGAHEARAQAPGRIPVPAPPPPIQAQQLQQNWRLPAGSPYVWVQGYYAWVGGGWVWVNGAYVLPPRPGMRWVKAHYRGGYWYPGYWK